MSEMIRFNGIFLWRSAKSEMIGCARIEERDWIARRIPISEAVKCLDCRRTTANPPIGT
jgi:hypothetical protein